MREQDLCRESLAIKCLWVDYPRDADGNAVEGPLVWCNRSFHDKSTRKRHLKCVHLKLSRVVCDRCGAQAYVRVQLNAGGELLFCAHHGREHRDALRAAGADIHDESQKLVATSSTASLDER